MKNEFKNLKVRNVAIAKDRGTGMSYKELGDKYGLSKMQIGRILKDDEIKAIIDHTTTNMVALLPEAWEVHQKAMRATDKSGNPTANALRAAETVLKVGAVMPSNVVNQRITNIVNQQNNFITPELMEFAKKILPGFKVDDVKDVSGDARYC